MKVDSPHPLLRLGEIHKRFPGVHALKGMDLELNRGECVALLGENGAGKSTLIKVLGGAHQPDEGKLEMEGQERKFLKPTDSLDAGIAIIYPGIQSSAGIIGFRKYFSGNRTE